MCGITSIFRNNLKTSTLALTKLVQQLIWVGSIRGYDATGIFYSAGDDQAEWYKRALTGWDFQYLPQASQVLFNHELTKYLVMHNRAATRGSSNHDTAHPFQIGDITGVHNGTLTAYNTLSPQGFNSPVDSAHVFAGIDEAGSEDIIPRLQGSFNLLWHDNSDNTIHQVKNDDRSYTFAKLKNHDILVGASEKAMLKWLVGRNGLEIEFCWDPENYVENVWSVEEDMVRPQYTVEHEKYVAPVITQLQTTRPLGDSAGPYSVRVEFFFNEKVAQSHVLNGKVHYNYFGQTVDGEEVVCYSVPEGKYEFDTWYVADAWETTALSKKRDYYRIQEKTIVDHPIEDPTNTFHKCTSCEQEYSENETIFMDANPVCVTCAHELAVDVGEIDAGHEWKLYKH